MNITWKRTLLKSRLIVISTKQILDNSKFKQDKQKLNLLRVVHTYFLC